MAVGVAMVLLVSRGMETCYGYNNIIIAIIEYDKHIFRPHKLNILFLIL